MVSGSANILLVDDEPLVRRTIRKTLERENYQCQEAENAFQAVEKLESSPFDLAILDIKMPQKSGFDLLPELKLLFPDLAVIMATAVVDANTIIECMRRGAVDYLPKPFQPSELCNAVESALKKRDLELEIRSQVTNLEVKLEEQRKKIRNLYLDAIESLVSALEAKDKYTAGHSRRVNLLSMAIARELKLSDDDLEDIRWGSLLHDVGKIAIDSSIQNKKAPLTEEEYRHVMIHAHVGPGIVKNLTNRHVVDIIKYHHAHYDGNHEGQDVKGDEIPLGARIVTVADSYDAMTSDRPYRSAMSPEQAIAELKRCSGTQFDPIVVETFLKVIKQGKPLG